ncbi:Cys-tRNA(Pro) deacylase [Herbiconiux sp. L3-i23]|uniref:Cys-tRNA(Pro) deacylase n=1 Tax=Herbiconiux sp. L3-i23 TaxID=2905871 RepID=UPI002064BDC2|nr:Cys-tRNA(Pro) deacylase [Herbiconiux sp. L3-i23]BDI22365.1 Cys-tRNA(Pro)/Cys-tRNA(Cys) deacylase [Herbiconiux sp. L3-i23]
MSKRAAGGGATPATVALERAGVEYRTHSYEHDPAHPSYGLEAAEALGVDPARVFKTLVVSADGRLAVGIVPVSASLDLRAMAAALGAKRVGLADQRDAERKTGYVAGGISPIGQKTALPTVLDESALAWPTIHVSGGRRGFELELTPAALQTATSATTAPLSR